MKPSEAGYVSRKCTAGLPMIVLEERAIRLELRAAVNHEPQVRPDVGDAFAAGFLFEAVEQGPAATKARR